MPTTNLQLPNDFNGKPYFPEPERKAIKALAHRAARAQLDADKPAYAAVVAEANRCLGKRARGFFDAWREALVLSHSRKAAT